MKKIKESYKIFVPTDKLRNSYLLRKDEYKEFSKNKDIHKEKHDKGLRYQQQKINSKTTFNG